MTELERLARSVSDTFGIHHLRALQSLRTYIAGTDDRWLISEIMEIPEARLLRSLLEAGLRQPLLDTVLKRAEEFHATE